jgi:hypothetical protein
MKNSFLVYMNSHIKNIFILITLSILISFISTSLLINYDSIYYLNTILKFNEKIIYKDFIPLTGNFPIWFFGTIFGFLKQIFPLGLLIIINSIIFTIIQTLLFYYISFFTTKKKGVSTFIGIISLLSFSLNFGLSFYDDYFSYTLLMFALILDYKKFNFFVPFLLYLAIQTKITIGLPAFIIFLVYLILVRRNYFSFFYNFFLVVLLLMVNHYFFSNYQFFNFYNYEILRLELDRRQAIDTTHLDYDRNLFIQLFDIIKFLFLKIVFPWKLNVFDSITTFSLGRILFIPFILLHYFSIIILINRFFNFNKFLFIEKKYDYLLLLIVFSYAPMAVLGRAFIETIYGYIFVILIIYELKYFTKYKKIIISIFILILLIFKLHKLDVINPYEYDTISSNEIIPIQIKIDNNFRFTNEIDLQNIVDKIKNKKVDNIYCLEGYCLLSSFLLGINSDEHFPYPGINFVKKFDYNTICTFKIDQCEQFILNDLKKKGSEYIIYSKNSRFFKTNSLSKVKEYIDLHYELILSNSLSLYKKK